MRAALLLCFRGPIHMAFVLVIMCLSVWSSFVFFYLFCPCVVLSCPCIYISFVYNISTYCLLFTALSIQVTASESAPILCPISIIHVVRFAFVLRSLILLYPLHTSYLSCHFTELEINVLLN